RAGTGDAFVSDHWLPISPVSGRLDAFEWKDPLAGEDHGTVIEHRAEPSAPAAIETPAAAPGVTSPRVRGEQSRPSAGVLSAKDADANASATARSAAGEGGPPQTEAPQPAPPPPPLSGKRMYPTSAAHREPTRVDPSSGAGGGGGGAREEEKAARDG